MGLKWPIKSIKPWVLIILVFLLYDLALGWWATIPPTRPTNIPSESVFIISPSGGFILPQPKNGDWLYCWFDKDRKVDRCQMTDTNGKLEYEGDFTPSDGSEPVAQSGLEIDAKHTGPRLRWILYREQIIPIIQLRGGKVLIPVEGSDLAKQQLKFEQEYHH